MFSVPDDPTAARMRTARQTARAVLNVRDTNHELIWGYQGRLRKMIRQQVKSPDEQ